MNKNIYIGAMSGTSHDAVDVSIIEVINSRVQLKYFYSLSLPIKLKTKVRNAIESNHISLTDLGKLNKEIGFLFSKAINLAIDNSNIKKSKIVCASISGQTIRHEINKKYPFSMQIGDPNVVSKEINLPVVSDFRNMHIALGGDGAPLVTEFHNQIFYKPKCTRIILNIGGISNFGNKIKIKELKKIQKSFLVDIVRFSIKRENISMPSKKVIEEIIKTFIQSSPGPKSEVSWTRSDKEQSGGKIFYKDKCIVITKK